MKYGTQLLFHWWSLETSGNFDPSLYLLEKSGHQEISALPALNLVGMPLGSAPPVPRLAQKIHSTWSAADAL